jgi:hypothetical protein
MGLVLLPDASVKAQTAAAEIKIAQALSPDSPVSRRPPTRIRVHPYYYQDGVYPRYNPGPDAVRVCSVVYAREYRPSGTVIVPHMSCHWRHG